MGLDERASVFLERLVSSLEERGVRDPAVLDAFRSVPRHRFVDQFTVARGLPEPAPKRFAVGAEAGDDVLEAVYAPDLALVTAESRLGATSSLSAPYLIAGMLEELGLAPGHRVLEIGAGSGYHAALMAHIVGDPALITTIDIDPAIVATARARLAQLGLRDLTVLCGDGDGGAPDDAPFDRIVATVGCADISPAWIQQLAGDGQLLVPLALGAAHPRVRLRPNGQGATGAFVGRSGFVRMQGVQGHASPWSQPTSAVGPPANVTTEPLPKDLRDAFMPDPAIPLLSMAALDLGMYLALRDHRASFVATLVDGGSMAGVEGTHLLLHGERAADLALDLVNLIQDWRALGSPSVTSYETVFEPAPVGRPHLIGGGPTGPWHVRRLRFLQDVRLSASSRVRVSRHPDGRHGPEIG